MDWGTVGAVVGFIGVPAATLITFFVGRRRREKNEDQESITEAVSSLASGAQTVSESVTVLLAPLQERVTAQDAELQLLRQEVQELREQSTAQRLVSVSQATRIAEQDKELENFQQVLSRFKRHIVNLREYVNMLRGQLEDVGHDPIPPPNGVDIVLDWDELTG